MIRYKRIVDLSNTMIPGKEEYGLELETHNTADLYPQYPVTKGTWYILQTLHMGSHCGTHIEFPYHHNCEGLNAAEFPLERLIGDCLLLDFRHKKADEAVTLEELESDYRIRTNDMLLFNFDCAQYYGTDKGHDRPYIAHDAIQWLIFEKQVNLVGTDASGIEVKGVPDQPNHALLMKHQIPILEFVANLNALEAERFTLLVLPMRIVELDSCPVRLIAIEEEE